MSQEEILFALIRLGIGHTATITEGNIEWDKVKALAEEQGLSAVVLDGIEKLPEGQRPPKVFLLEWIGETLQGYEYRYELYRRAIAELACFYNSHGYKMMVIKGLACGIHWPKPEHRPYGDIDIWQFGKQKKADALLADEKGIDIDQSHHHHTVFYWRDFMVENHYDFLNVHQHKSNEKLEKMIKQLAKDDSYSVDLMGEKVYLPSPNLHAIFLLRHAMTHFAASEINLRQLLDWAFFVEKYGKDVDWKWLKEVLEEFGMLPMFNIFNAICVEDLGFDIDHFPKVQFIPFVKERVLNDILSPEFCDEEPKGLIPGSLFKYKRWRANQWKHDLCFNDSLWSAFWTGIWGHLMKPNH